MRCDSSPTVNDKNSLQNNTPTWWLAPAVIILLPVLGSFAAWASLIGWCSAGGCPAGSWLDLRGFLEPAPVTIAGATLLIVWYCVVVVLATIGWRLGVGRTPAPEFVERTTSAQFERRYFFLILTAATIGVAYAYYRITSATSIVDALTTQTGNAFTEALPDSAGIATLRYATILAAPISVYLWRKKVIHLGFMLFAVFLLMANSMVASRLSLLMAVVVYAVLQTAVHRKPARAGRASVRPWHIVTAVAIMFILLTGLNYVRNGNYYRDAGVSNPVAMNLYQSGAYLAVPAQVSTGVSDAVMRGTFDKPSDVIASVAAALPSFLVPAHEVRAKESLSADSYEFSVSFAPNFTTNSEFADIYADFGAWGWLYTLLLFPLAGYVFGRFLTYGPIIAGSAGVIAYCFAEVWRIQLLTQGITVFLVLLTLACMFVAARGRSPGKPQGIDSKGNVKSVTSKFAVVAYQPGNTGSEWLRSAVGAVRNRWIILLMGALVGGSLGAILTTAQSPSYESSAVIYQTPHFGDTDGMSRQRTEAYTNLLSSDLLIETALRNAGLEMSISDVREMTTASANIGSAILTVTVRADDADTSAALANALAQALPGTVADLDGTATVDETAAAVDQSNVVVDQSNVVVTEPVRLSVVSPAVSDDAEGGPKYGRNIALGVIAGLLVGLLYAYLRTQVSRNIQDANALGKFLSGPVLATIPPDKAMETGVVDFPKDGPAAEAFRRLRTVIADHEPGRAECRTIIVSSAVGGDGKTAVAVNLAVSLAEMGNAVVFVDAAASGDVTGRSGRHGFDPKSHPTPGGLTDYLQGEGDIDQFVSTTWHPNLSLIPAGRSVAGQSELLGTSRMRTGLADLATRANYVIVDTAPLADRSDALVLGRWSDGVLLVARSEHTRYAELGAAIERLSLADVPVCGVVLNDSPRPLVRSARAYRTRLSATRLLARESRAITANA